MTAKDMLYRNYSGLYRKRPGQLYHATMEQIAQATPLTCYVTMMVKQIGGETEFPTTLWPVLPKHIGLYNLVKHYPPATIHGRQWRVTYKTHRDTKYLGFDYRAAYG